MISQRTKMDDNDTGQLPFIEYRKNTTPHMSGVDEVYLVVRGPTLDECRKHFDEILEKTDVKK